MKRCLLNPAKLFQPVGERRFQSGKGKMTVISAFQWAGKRNRYGVTLARRVFDGWATRIAKPHNFGAFIKSLAGGIIHCRAIAVIAPGASNG